MADTVLLLSGVYGSLVAATTMGHKGTVTQWVMTSELRNCLINWAIHCLIFIYV
jgi:hypothetical protein